METLDLNEHSKFILSNFEKDIDFYKEDLFHKMNNDLNKYKTEIFKSSNNLLENLSKAGKLNNNKTNSSKDELNLYDKNIIKINISGTIFKTKSATLLKYSNSKLAEIFKLIKKGNLPADYSDEEGLIFFDRNPKYFEFVLDAIRNDMFIETQDDCVNQYIRKELEYFNLENFFVNKKSLCIDSNNKVNYNQISKNNINSNEQVNKLPIISEVKAVKSPKKSEKKKESFSPSHVAQNTFNNPKSCVFPSGSEGILEENESRETNSDLEINTIQTNNDFNKINNNNQKAAAENFNNEKIKIKNNKIITKQKFEFDKNYKNSNLKLTNDNKTIENCVGWEDAAALSNIEMSHGKFEWEIFIEDLAYDNWITIGIAEKAEISKEMKDEHVNSWSISSTKESWRMNKPINNLKQNNSYFCFLDFKNDLFRIIGPGVDSQNFESVKGKSLFVLVNVFNSKNRLTVRNFVCFSESLNE